MSLIYLCIDEILSKANLDNNILTTIIKESLQNLDIYRGYSNLDDCLTYDEKHEYYHISCIEKYYFLSKKYHISKYKNQEFYNYSLQFVDYLGFSSLIENLQSFCYICEFDFINRDFSAELEGLESGLYNLIDDIYDLEDLEELKEVLYEIDESYNLPSSSFNMIENKSISIRNSRSYRAKNTLDTDEEYKENDISNQEITWMFNTLKTEYN